MGYKRLECLLWEIDQLKKDIGNIKTVNATQDLRLRAMEKQSEKTDDRLERHEKVMHEIRFMLLVSKIILAITGVSTAERLISFFLQS